jgi:hypothetical protein
MMEWKYWPHQPELSAWYPVLVCYDEDEGVFFLAELGTMNPRKVGIRKQS